VGTCGIARLSGEDGPADSRKPNVAGAGGLGGAAIAGIVVGVIAFVAIVGGVDAHAYGRDDAFSHNVSLRAWEPTVHIGLCLQSAAWA